MLRLLPLLLLTPLLSGCNGLTSLAKQLKNDPAVVKMDIVTLYGTGKFIRIGNNTNSIVVDPDNTVHINEKR